MTLDKYVAGIAKTGFPFEHRVSSRFRARNWDVQHGKHYVDDVEGKVREIDIIADLEDDVDGLEVHTVCIVSCKASAERAWVMLSRPGDPGHWMRERDTRHASTTDDVLRHMFQGSIWPFDYDEALNASARSVWSEPDQVVFAFQEMDNQSGTAKDNKNIFAAITSLLKAQAYEIAARSSVSKSDGPKVFQYNLLNVVDAPLIRLDYPEGNGQPEALEVTGQTCLADYIVNQTPVSALVRFVAASALDDELAELQRLHAHNLSFFAELRRKFYPDALKDWSKRKLFERAVADEVAGGWGLRLAAEQLSLQWDSRDASASMSIKGARDRDIQQFNDDAGLRDRLRSSLATHYRYTGESKFSSQQGLDALRELVESLSNFKRSDAG